MKNAFFAFLFGIVMISVTSCKLNNNNNPTPPVASFGFVNASTNAGNVDIYLNSAPVVYNLPYGKDTGYFNILPGGYSLMIDTAGSLTPRVNNSVSFSPGFFYSIFIIDSASNSQIAEVQDNFTTPSSDSADVRFFNFSPNAPALDVAIGGNVLFSNRTFNDISENGDLGQFTYIAPGTYTVELRAAGTSNVLASASVTISGGKVYTLYAKGYAEGAGPQPLSIGTVVHNQ
jgi:Domain of unknown function (DUF4397)